MRNNWPAAVPVGVTGVREMSSTVPSRLIRAPVSVGLSVIITTQVPSKASLSEGSANAVARPLLGGLWDITVMTLPSGGTVETPTPTAGTSRIVFSIGERAIHRQIDPDFVHPSPSTAKPGDIRSRSGQGIQHANRLLAVTSRTERYRRSPGAS